MKQKFHWIQQIQGIWWITKAWIGVNLRILSVTSVFWLCGNFLVFYTRGCRFEFILLNLLNLLKTFKENSNKLFTSEKKHASSKSKVYKACGEGLLTWISFRNCLLWFQDSRFHYLTGSVTHHMLPKRGAIFCKKMALSKGRETSYLLGLTVSSLFHFQCCITGWQIL